LFQGDRALGLRLRLRYLFIITRALRVEPVLQGLLAAATRFVSRELETGSNPVGETASLPTMAALTSPGFRAN
jgi:hypothetical protein